MSLNVTVTNSFTDGATPLAASNVIAVDIVEKLNAVAPTGGGGTKLNVNFKASGLQMVYLAVSGLTAGQQVTLTTYSDDKATQAGLLDTITLTQGKPIQWQSGAGACPLQVVADVKSIRIANATGASATVDIELGING